VPPRFAPTANPNRRVVRACAARAGLSVEEFLEPIGPPVSSESAGAAVVGPGPTKAVDVAPAYVLAGAGPETLP
jgi:3-oxoacyl-[acyl-carrier protein] reductase